MHAIALLVSDPRQEILTKLKDKFPGIRTSESNMETIGADILILAVKPQLYENVISGIAESLNKETVIVTIAAGLTLKNVSKWLAAAKKSSERCPTPRLWFLKG